MKKHLSFAAMLFVAGLAFTSCKPEKGHGGGYTPNGGNASLKFNLTDAPAMYDEVNVDILSVEVHVDTRDTANPGGWQQMTNVQPGIYNLLDFQNGLDTLIASGDVPAGRISQIRLILGSNNTIVENGVSSPLKTPSGQQSGVKLKVNETITAGLTYEFWLDFDASRSVVKKGHGGYSLKPVIRVFSKLAAGSIDGYVTPDTAYSQVLAYNAAGDSASALTDTATGYFMISGLDAASYTVEFDPIAPFIATDTVVNVMAGATTHLDTIAIQQ